MWPVRILPAQCRHRSRRGTVVPVAQWPRGFDECGQKGIGFATAKDDWGFRQVDERRIEGQDEQLRRRSANGHSRDRRRRHRSEFHES